MIRLALPVPTLVAVGALTPAAAADGLPVVGVDVGSSGVLAPGDDARYVTLPAGRDTLVARVERDGGRVLRSLLVPGRFTIAAVAYDGSAAGLSADGRTLVLIRPRARFPRAQTVFAVLDAGRMRLRDTVTLRGDFSFDAISPSGSWLYLVQYLSPRDPTRYLVRLYDLRAGRLLPEPIIDPREVGNVMRGSPITRAASPDGRWAYTLYDGAGDHPFIHALDTVGLTARCIDLHELAAYPDLFELRLRGGGGGGGYTLTVVDGDELLAVVNTRTFSVTDPAGSAEVRRTPPRQVSPKGDDDGFAWEIVAAPGAGGVLVGLGLSVMRWRKRRLAPTY